MNQHNFGAAVIPAMAGFLFWKRAKVQEIREEKKQTLPAVISSDVATITGVAKYLAAAPVITSVAKYLKREEQYQTSSVEKYILRRTIAEKNTQGPTGVSKYLSNSEKQSPKIQKSSVDKYLTNLEFAAKQAITLTGVAKYAAEQNLIERKKAAAAMIEHYKQQEAAAVLASKQAAENAALESSKLRYQEMAAMEAPAATGVGRYVQILNTKVNNTPKVTGVARYLAKKIVADSQKPVLSGVAKYLRDQNLLDSRKPALTGVAKYLSKLPNVNVKPRKEAATVSGVAKYLTAMEIVDSAKPIRSGVAKYLDKQAQLEAQNTKLIEQLTIEEAHRSVEGEFIPAREESLSETGVSKYLQKQDALLATVVTDEIPVLSGVAKYLNKKSQQTGLTTISRPTGVDRYLLGRA